MRLSVFKVGPVLLVLCAAYSGWGASEVVEGAIWNYRVSKNSVAIESEYDASKQTEPQPAFLMQSGSRDVIKIPSELGGRNVTRLGLRAVQIDEDGLNLISVPSNISHISAASFVSGKIGSSGNDNWCNYSHKTISSVGVTNVLFMGDCPDISFVNEKGYKTYNGTLVGDDDSSEIKYRDGWGIKWYGSSSSPLYYCYGAICISGGQFSDCTCWIVEGSKGWNMESPRTFCGAKEIRYGAARVEFSREDGCTLDGDEPVSLTCRNPSAAIYYTCDGSDPVAQETSRCHLYTRPITISGDTTVKAIAAVSSYPYDVVSSRQYYLGIPRVAAPVVSGSQDSVFGVKNYVTLSCSIEGVAIYFTLDGSTPSATSGRLYTGPFNIYQTTTVKAIAVKDDWKDSEVVTATYTKANELGPAMNLLEVLPDNDATYPWTVVTDVTHDGKSAVKSGAIDDEESTTIKAVIYGAGTLSFWWKANCEPAIDGEYYDFATFFNGSTEVARLAGETDWQRVTLDVSGTGKHTFKWTYQKDDSGSTIPDCVWVDQVQWLPATTTYYSDATLTTEVPVKYSWLHRYGLDMKMDFETAASALTGKVGPSGRPLSVADDYIAGTDPTNSASRLESKIEMVDGHPQISWSPDLNENGTKALRSYKIWGRDTLDEASSWCYPTNAGHHFFKVSVEMP